MKSLLFFISIAISISTNAQVTKVSLQASGLTCSMCSNSINKALKTLDFVEKVDPDIKTYTFEISFKANSNVDFDEIKSKVENAGFTVSGLIATIYFDNTQVMNNQPVAIGDKRFLFVNVKDQLLNGAIRVKILEKGFVPSKYYKTLELPKSPPGTYHVTI